MMRSVVMIWTELAILLALAVYLGTMVHCARMRARHRIMAPATTGHPDYERAFRVQQNTLEQLVVFIPAVWLFSALVNPLVGAGLGAIWVLARALYAVSYIRAPEKRGPGFIIGFVTLIVLVAGALVELVASLPLVL